MGEYFVKGYNGNLIKESYGLSSYKPTNLEKGLNDVLEGNTLSEKEFKKRNPKTFNPT